MPRKNIIDTFVVENPTKSGIITDMCSFYHVPSTILGNKDYKILNDAYSYYNVATSVPLSELINDLLVIARNKGFDVFNMLDIMGNKKIFEERKFLAGNGFLQYYLFNWRCKEIPPEQIGLITV